MHEVKFVSRIVGMLQTKGYEITANLLQDDLLFVPCLFLYPTYCCKLKAALN
jgi:hypothetical protein